MSRLTPRSRLRRIAPKARLPLNMAKFVALCDLHSEISVIGRGTGIILSIVYWRYGLFSTFRRRIHYEHE